MYIANQHRRSTSHENQLEPPSTAEDGKLRTGNKARLLECSEEKHVTVGMSGQASFDCQIDGGTLVNILPTTGAITFHDFASKIFLGHISHLLLGSILCKEHCHTCIPGKWQPKKSYTKKQEIQLNQRIPGSSFAIVKTKLSLSITSTKLHPVLHVYKVNGSFLPMSTKIVKCVK